MAFYFLLCLVAASGLGIGLGWVLKARVVNKHLVHVEDAWAARVQDKAREGELTIAKLGSLLHSLQTSYAVAQTTIRAHEASLTEYQAKLSALETHCATQTQAWEARYDAALQGKDEEIKRWQRRVWELEPFPVRVQEWEANYLLITRDKEAQIRQLQSRICELERLRRQTEHWKFSALLHERKLSAPKLALGRG